MKKRTVERYAYKNTTSEAGRPEKYTLRIKSIHWINTWTNYYGNPTYMFYMDDGTTYLMVDDYGCMNDIPKFAKVVGRKKDL